MPLDEDLQNRKKAYQRQLAEVGRDGREALVDAARRNEDWPEPRERYLAGHAGKHGMGVTGRQYAQQAYDTKNRPGVRVYAYVHPTKRNRGLAFVDLNADWVVLFDCDLQMNFDYFRPTNGSRAWVADKTATGTHWRLSDTER